MARKNPEATKSNKKAKGTNRKSAVDKTEYQLARDAAKKKSRRKKCGKCYA